MQRITPFLWFDDKAEEAATFYCAIFSNSKVIRVSRYGEAAAKAAGKSPGTAMVVEFELEGQKFSAINGGPQFKFSPAVSFVVTCETQEEIDFYWDKLGSGGDEKAQQCGWLADKYGLSWQIVPTALPKLMTSGTPAQSGAVMQAMLKMKKLDITGLQRAYDGATAA